MMVDLPEETPDNMLQQPYSLLLDQLSHHIAENRTDSVESLIRMADISQSSVVE